MAESLRDQVAPATGTIGAGAAVIDGRADRGAGTAASRDASAACSAARASSTRLRFAASSRLTLKNA